MRTSTYLAALALGTACAGAQAATLTIPTGTWGFDLAGRDLSVKPGDDFFQYSDGTYVKNLQIPPDQVRYGAFNVLRDLSEARTHGILEQAAKSGDAATPVGKAGVFYKAFMDQGAVDAAGAKPLASDFGRIRAVKNASDFARLCGEAQSTFLGSVFDLSIAPDAKDPTHYAVYVAQSGLGLPDRDYYVSSDFANKRAKYGAFVEKLLTLAGWPDASAASGRIVAFETKIADASWSRADQRDDDKTYNPVKIGDLAKAAPGFDWAAFLDASKVSGKTPYVVLNENTAIAKIAAMIPGTDVQTLRDWAAFHLTMNAAPVLSAPFVAANFEFMGHELQGQPVDRPRWKKAVHATEMALGEAVGEQYVAQFFPADSREKMAALTHDLRDAFHARLEANDWMMPATKAKALEKLGTFDFQIGAPKKWRDYSGLRVDAHDAFGNAERSAAFEWAFWLSHLGGPTDRDLWEMYPQTVNAYNEPLLNEVVFPAAILQPPFFNPSADPAVNYGAIGGVIGHEMTHSFDDQGRKHDAHGRLANWWTPEDAKRFEERAKRFGAQYAAMDVVSGAKINPELTMGENIADLGGLTLALEAYHRSLHGKTAPVLNGLTGDQRVFLGWAQVWRGKVRPDAARQALAVDPHSPPKARVNGPMENLDDWYTAWDVKPGDKLYLKPEDRVRIW